MRGEVIRAGEADLCQSPVDFGPPYESLTEYIIAYVSSRLFPLRNEGCQSRQNVSLQPLTRVLYLDTGKLRAP